MEKIIKTALIDKNLDMTINLEKLLIIINDHIKFYKELNINNAEDIINYIKDLLKVYNIKVCYEHLSCLEKIKKDQKDQKDQVSRFRMSLSTNRYKANFEIPLIRECNGAIIVVESLLDAIKVRLLAKPTNDFNPKFNQQQLGKYITKKCYHIYQLLDGTTINLFYDDQHFENAKKGKWIFSTKNSFNINQMNWRGFNYLRVIEHVLSKYNFSFEKLSVNKTYSLGFKHPAFHPFGQPDVWEEKHFQDSENKKWIISAWVINADTEEIGLPVQQKINQSEVLENFKKLSGSLKDYIDNVNINKKANAWENVSLGLILRSVNPEITGEYSDIILESTLWQEIRRMIYQLPYIQNKAIRDKTEQNFKNMQYIVLDSFIDFRKNNIFISLFPQYRTYYYKYNQTINLVVDLIYDNILINHTKGGKLEETERKKDYDKREQEINLRSDNDKKTIRSLFNYFSSIIYAHYQITPELDHQYKKTTIVKNPGISKVDKKNIKTLIMHNKYIETYYDKFYLQFNTQN